MRLRVQYTGQLRTVIGHTEEHVDLPEGSDLTILLSHLASRHGEGTRPHLLAANGGVQPGLMVVVNGRAHSARDAESRVLNAEDTVLLMPPIAGG
ncbi:MAG: MoaD/ThiS family protein [Pirellulaceae bacterium]